MKKKQDLGLLHQQTPLLYSFNFVVIFFLTTYDYDYNDLPAK